MHLTVDNGWTEIYYTYTCKYFIHKLLSETRQSFSIPFQLWVFAAEVCAQDRSIWLDQLTENCANLPEQVFYDDYDYGERVYCLEEGPDGEQSYCDDVEAEIGELPWQANLVRKYNRAHFCGGILISDRFVLTAAHCLENNWAEDILVILGDHNTDNNNDTYETEHDVKKIILHPGYFKGYTDSFYQLHNDIALLQLSKPARIRNGTRNACLPKYEPKTGANDMLISGWGATPNYPYSDVLLKAEVYLISRKTCEEMYRIPTGYSGKTGNITEGMICAASPGKDTCQGDSGGIL